MRRLVVLAGDGGPAFVDGLRRAWDAGDAAAVLDPRLPPAAAEATIAAFRRDEPVDDGDALVVATSGTTGAPKAVVLTHDAVAAHAAAVHERLAVDPAADRWLACLPLAHVGGLGVVVRALVTGTPVEVLPAFDASEVQRAARERGATLTALVPTALGRVDATLFRWVVLGGSADWRDRPANVVRTYGLTESGGGVVYDGVPLAGVEVRTVDGELHLRGPMLARSYRDGTATTDADGWLRTGDLGAVEPSTGIVSVQGRAGDLIVTGGENVWPEPVEAALRRHPGVADVAVAGRADPEWGQRVVAFVVPRASAEPPTLEELRARAKDDLPAFAAPRELVLVDTLPRTALGKVRRTALL